MGSCRTKQKRVQPLGYQDCLLEPKIAASDKEWKHLEPGALFTHRLIVRRRGETAGRVEYLREQMDIANGGEEDLGSGENPVHSRVDVALLIERLVPCGACALATPPRATRNRFDSQHRDVPLGARGEDPFENGGVMGVLHH